MRSIKRGGPCLHFVRPPLPYNCVGRGRQVRRAEELGRSVFDDHIAKGVFPVEGVDDGELVIGEEEAQVVETLPTPYLPLRPKGTITN